MSQTLSFFFFQAEDGIRDIGVTGVQTCALPIFVYALKHYGGDPKLARARVPPPETMPAVGIYHPDASALFESFEAYQIGRASCRERVEISVGAVSLKKKKREE